MILSESHNFIFVHIHKTAGEAITLALLPHLGPKDFALGATPLGNVRNLYYERKHGISKHSSASEIREYVDAENWNRFFVFSFVRHPFERARSLYKYFAMMSERRNEKNLRNMLYRIPFLKDSDPLKWPGLQAYSETSSFSEFIRHPSFHQDPGSHCQCDMLLDENGNMLADFVGHFDRLEADFAHVATRIGLSQVTLPKYNISKSLNRTDITLSGDDIIYLREIYAHDFERFWFDL
jgi:Sulfotransferase family